MSEKKQLAKLEFVAFCIEQHKRANDMDGGNTEQLFKRCGLLDFLLAHYDVLHTQSAANIEKEMVQYLNNHCV
ncbi:MAG: DUF3791 domain-containing protein [Bacteroidales bacterium]|nr:DUF3791 domain-containing protein [Bacteroidales bacterium]